VVAVPNQAKDGSASASVFSDEFTALYNELMDFKDDPVFHENGFSPNMRKFKDWQDRTLKLAKRQAPSHRAGVAAGELFQLALEYRRSRGQESRYTATVVPNMADFVAEK